MRTMLAIFALAILTGCSGNVTPPEVKLGKKCMTNNDGTVVYSYVWIHKKGTELEADNETCKLIED
tara:strand:- start:2698 stop:2895 length:198 start_codon:yes stop_codon:yes gene_type:complete